MGHASLVYCRSWVGLVASCYFLWASHMFWTSFRSVWDAKFQQSPSRLDIQPPLNFESSWKISPHVLEQISTAYRRANMRVKPGCSIPSPLHAVLYLTWDLFKEASYSNRNFTIWYLLLSSQVFGLMPDPPALRALSCIRLLFTLGTTSHWTPYQEVVSFMVLLQDDPITMYDLQDSIISSSCIAIWI